MSKLLSKLNETLEYNINHNALIGRQGEYWFSITHEDDGKPILLRSGVTSHGVSTTALEEFLAAKTDLYKIRSVHIDNHEFIVEFFNQYGPTKSTTLLAEFIREISWEFSKLGLESACGFCGLPGHHQPIRAGKVVAEACESCIIKQTEILNEEAKKTLSSGSYLTGLVGALLGGLLGVVLWVAVAFVSLVNPAFYPGFAGFFMALFARAGYKLFKGRIGTPMYAIVGIATALTVFLAIVVEIAISSAPPQILPLSLAIQAFTNSELFNTNTAWQKLFVGWAIAAIGGYGAFTTMFKEVQDHSEGVENIK